MSDAEFATAFLHAARQQLKSSTTKVVHCLNQLSPDQIWWRPGDSLNSIGILVVHLCGNIRQWIHAGVGDAEDLRDRPGEFAGREQLSLQVLLDQLEQCMQTADTTLAAADRSILLEPRRIQGHDTTRLAAILDTVSHFQGHAQEIISLTRQQLGESYQFHWVPSTPEETSARSE